MRATYQRTRSNKVNTDSKETCMSYGYFFFLNTDNFSITVNFQIKWEVEIRTIFDEGLCQCPWQSLHQIFLL